ncbi:hypothetical protein [Streptomyces fodineus]|nr:hypothetical protein [Streptomyces fodineus]
MTNSHRSPGTGGTYLELSGADGAGALWSCGGRRILPGDGSRAR